MNNHATILSYIESHRTEAIAFLQRMVAFDSSTIHHGLDGQEIAIQELLAGVLAGSGLETRLFEPDNEKMRIFSGLQSRAQLSQPPQPGGDAVAWA